MERQLSYLDTKQHLPRLPSCSRCILLIKSPFWSSQISHDVRLGPSCGWEDWDPGQGVAWQGLTPCEQHSLEHRPRGWGHAPSCHSKLALIRADGPDTIPLPSSYHSPRERQSSFWNTTLLLLLDFRMAWKLIRKRRFGNRRESLQASVPTTKKPASHPSKVPNCNLRLPAFEGDPQALLLGVHGRRLHWSVSHSVVTRSHQWPKKVQDRWV